ncbi:hypothetical protein BJX70DRAFT_276134 [Aspergillus crustosus]
MALFLSDHLHLPPLSRPNHPIALRPESTLTADPETTITIRNSPLPWHPLNYTIEHERGPTIFRVHGHPWGLVQRREFRYASGIPLFELKSRWFDSSALELKLPGASAEDEILLQAKCWVSVKSPRAVLRFRNACLPTNNMTISNPARAATAPTFANTPQLRQCLRPTPTRSRTSSSSRSIFSINPETETVMEIHSLDVDNLVQVATVENQRVAYIDRVTDPGVLAQGQKPPFRFRPMWRVRVATGVDLALIAVAVVIIGQQVSGVVTADR